MKSKTGRKKIIIIITVVVLILAAAAVTAAYYFTHREDPVTVKSVDLKDNYQIIKETIEVGDLKATYFNERENKEWIEKIPDYTIFIDEKSAENKDGNVHVSVKNGDYTVTVKWEDQEGKPREYSQKVTLTNYYPMFVETGAQFTKKLGPFHYTYSPDSGPTYMTEVDIQIPEVQSTTQDYQACNAIIEKYAKEAIQAVQTLEKGGTKIFQTYEVDRFSVIKWVYKTHTYNDTTALILKYDVWGADWGGWEGNTGIYYNNKTGKCLTAEEYAEANGYSPEKVKSLVEAEIKKELPERVDYYQKIPNINQYNDEGIAFYFDSHGVHFELAYSD